LICHKSLLCTLSPNSPLEIPKNLSFLTCIIHSISYTFVVTKVTGDETIKKIFEKEYESLTKFIKRLKHETFGNCWSPKLDF